jgi:hypothetical protein
MNTVSVRAQTASTDRPQAAAVLPQRECRRLDPARWLGLCEKREEREKEKLRKEERKKK